MHWKPSTGPGIPAEYRWRISEPFYRLHSRERDAEIRLDLVGESMRMHRGEVAVLEGPEGGSCFRIALPLVSHGACDTHRSFDRMRQGPHATTRSA